MGRNTKFELEIFNFINKHYKKTGMRSSQDVVCYGDDVITLRGNMPAWKFPFIALKILNYYPQIIMVEFNDYYSIWIYTRETLSWCGYKVKSLK